MNKVIVVEVEDKGLLPYTCGKKSEYQNSSKWLHITIIRIILAVEFRVRFQNKVISPSRQGRRRCGSVILPARFYSFEQVLCAGGRQAVW